MKLWCILHVLNPFTRSSPSVTVSLSLSLLQTDTLTQYFLDIWPLVLNISWTTLANAIFPRCARVRVNTKKKLKKWEREEKNYYPICSRNWSLNFELQMREEPSINVALLKESGNYKMIAWESSLETSGVNEDESHRLEETFKEANLRKDENQNKLLLTWFIIFFLFVKELNQCKNDKKKLHSDVNTE